MIKTINVAEDFSRYPRGRARAIFKDGGERFREDFLVPALSSFEKVIVMLDGTEGYGSSFLEESFANLIRINGFEKSEILRRIEIISKDDPSLIDEIHQYIQEV